ncbi:MAG: T9SS type A sorting domain-containing protein [Draconibacterium sp.]
MKKITLLFIMLLIAFMASPQNKTDLQKKIKQAQEKMMKISERSAALAKYSNEVLTREQLLKSGMVTQRLDSTIDRVLNQETQLWQNDIKDEYIYDAELKNTSWVEKEWNLTTQNWNISSKIDLGYDAQKRVNLMLMYEKDEVSNALTPDSKILIHYNTDGKQDSTLTYTTPNEGTTWILVMKDVYYYNASKQLVKTEMWSLDEETGVLMLSMNIVYTYTASGKIKTLSENFIIEGDEMLWSKNEYNYDGADRLSTVEYSTVNFITFTLEKTSRDSYQYNASGKVSVEIYSTWNGSTWVDEDKYETQYNANGDVSVEIYSLWVENSWVQQDKDEYTYSNTNFTGVVFPALFYFYGLTEEEFSLNKLITGINSFEMVNGSWKNTGNTTFYYSGGTATNINEFENNVISVYPNPAAESVYFGWKGNNESLSLELYQITGAKVIDQIVYSNQAVSISHLQSGVYFYKLLKGQQNLKTGKLIKK